MMLTFTFVPRYGERTTRNMELNCQVECNANEDGRERKLLEIFCEIVTMMERSSGEMALNLSIINTGSAE